MGIRALGPGVWEFAPGTENDENEKLGSLVRLSRISPRTRCTHRFTSWVERDGVGEGFEAARAFVRGEIDPPFLLLYGLPGLGKTHLALAIGWNYLMWLRSVVYYQTESLLDALREGYRLQEELAPGEFHQDRYDVAMHHAMNVSLLILDDLGVEKGTEWAAAKLDAIVDYRYLEKLPMVITANTLELSERILDRMREGRIVRLRGQSYRKKVVQGS